MREVTIWLFKVNGKFYAEEKVQIPDSVGNLPYEIEDYLLKNYKEYPNMHVTIPMTDGFIVDGHPCMILIERRVWRC